MFAGAFDRFVSVSTFYDKTVKFLFDLQSPDVCCS